MKILFCLSGLNDGSRSQPIDCRDRKQRRIRNSGDAVRRRDTSDHKKDKKIKRSRDRSTDSNIKGEPIHGKTYFILLYTRNK